MRVVDVRHARGNLLDLNLIEAVSRVQTADDLELSARHDEAFVFVWKC